MRTPYEVGISVYFWIIRFVNIQLALYSHVWCNPPTSPKYLLMTMTNFNYEGSYDVGISFYFWIIRLVNSHLTLYNHVRCNPIKTPWHPWNTPHDNYKFQLWQLQISTMRADICQVSFVIFLLKLILAYLPPRYHGIYIMGYIWQPL